jgi:hypothetical protein
MTSHSCQMANHSSRNVRATWRMLRRASQQIHERLPLFRGQLLRLVQEEGAVKPQVLAHAADLVSMAPGRWRWIAGRRQPHGYDQFGDGGVNLEQVADGSMIDPSSRAGARMECICGRKASA